MPKAKKQASPACDWVFTLNNPTTKDVDKVAGLDYKYLVFSYEMAPETGTVHLQGFVQFREKLRLTALKKLLKRAHWEKRRGTPYEASHYCMKPVDGCDCETCEEERANPTHLDGPFEEGCMSVENQYKFHEIVKVIKKKGLQRAIERFPETYITCHNGMKALATHYLPKRDVIGC